MPRSGVIHFVLTGSYRRIPHAPCGRCTGNAEGSLRDPVTTVRWAGKRNSDGGSWTQARAEAIYESHKTPASLRGCNMDDDSNERAYLSGYADGEGCFCVSFNRSKRHKFGWEIRPSFSVSQNGDRAEVLELCQRLFGCGTIRPDRSDQVRTPNAQRPAPRNAVSAVRRAAPPSRGTQAGR